MRRVVAGLLVMAGLLAAVTALYLDAFVAALALGGLPAFVYGLAGYDIDGKPVDDGSGW